MTRSLSLVFLVACGAAGSSDQTAPDTTLGPSGSDALEDRMRLDPLMAHLEALQAIADANGGTRAAGTPGFDASVDYAVEVLEGAGYEVVREPFSYADWVSNGPSVLDVPAIGLSFASGQEIEAMAFSTGGDVTAELTAVDLVLPPTDSSSSTSGCEPYDFDGFPAGNVALLQRGTCLFAIKAANAQAAGASAAIIFNEGQPGRTGLESWQLDDSGEIAIPVLAATFGVGDALAAELDQGPLTVHLAADVEIVDRPSENVIAWTGGDPERILVVGGHLDSVPAGPGINDNGSGSALVLELAVQMAAMDDWPDATVQFSLWGSEEIGLLGSNAHVDALDDPELGRVIGNLNFDMVASPNGSRMIYDGDGDELGLAGPGGSDAIERSFEDFYAREGQDTVATLFDGRSDYLAFILEDIPAGGLFTGAEGLKTPAEVELFGGEAFEPRDACYHQACDTLENIDQQLFLDMARGAAYATWNLATDTAQVAAKVDRGRLAVDGHGCGHEAVVR